MLVFGADSRQLAAIVAEPAARHGDATRHFTGRLVWNEDATVRVFSPFAGRVRRLLAEVGQTVKKGDALAEIESPDFGQAQADAHKARADFILAENALSRARDLFEHGAVARKEVEVAEDTYENALTEKKRTEARLAIYDSRADRLDTLFTLPSPLGGVLVERNVSPGQEVRPDQMLANAPGLFAPLFVVSDPTRLWVLLDVTDLDTRSFRAGMPLRLRTRALGDQVFEGVVDVVGDALDPASRTVKVRGSVTNTDRVLKAEMYVTVDLPGENAGSSVDVPARAVYLKDNCHYVFLEQQPGRFERRLVKVEPERDGRVPIREGLNPGEKVVTEGSLLLQAEWESSQRL